MADGALPVSALMGTVLLGAVATASRCDPGKPGDTADSVLAETGDTEPHHCVDDTDESDTPPPDSEPADTGPDTAPVDTMPVDTGPVAGCPAGMVAVDGRYCIDRYEASRPDATASSAGVDSSAPTSRAGVQPWKVNTLDEADAACQAAGKRLCTPTEWTSACRGPDDTTYAYGDDYQATTCNGIDQGCDCGSASESCECDAHGGPYAGCYYDCGGSYGGATTGAYPDCTNGYGVFDMNGNLWEYVSGTDAYPVRGGAYNCGDSASYHRCDYVPGWNPSARGFRCCGDWEG